ncbi:hypothetical protein NW759_006725 [Fusarium solani]|nr:hypothetical protein NW759_006725 [Fusarium solani]
MTMSLIPLADGTIGVYTHDIDPDPHIWDNFDPFIPFETSESSEDEEETMRRKEEAERSAWRRCRLSLLRCCERFYRLRECWLQLPSITRRYEHP